MKPPFKTPTLLFVFVLSIVFSTVSCEDKKSNKSENTYEKTKQKDSILEIPEEKVDPPLVINYKIDSLKTSVELDSFKNRYSEAHQNVIYAINRIEANKVSIGKSIVIPDTLFNDIINYSPFPKNMELLKDIPKTVLISQRVQGFALYENGKLIKWGPLSSGKKSTPTPNGLHYGNYKAKRKISSVDEAWILPYYFNFMNFEGVGVHQYALPGYPASHACVRLYMDDAQYIYDWAKQWELNSNGRKVLRKGTPFMVFGTYDYENESPWLQLATDRLNNNLIDEEMDTLKDYVAKYNEYIKTIDRNDLKKELSLDEGTIVTYN
ncbi:L,D-transpeptidase [Gillisia hiemivivida]|uniref:L,D-transpeptidase n=1 Tax=Gillisia hiemivivida TaxID=291190 RepID=A0A5C6ZZM2_9FLAO|nr:L,D-transpeptidase [Gillisia hiemivivida]TXD94275.1 L,D-transpeptidase [Gillisia hiemivivida]